MVQSVTMIERLQQWLRRHGGELPIAYRFQGQVKKIQGVLIDVDETGILVRQKFAFAIPWSAIGFVALIGDEYPHAPPVE